MHSSKLRSIHEDKNGRRSAQVMAFFAKSSYLKYLEEKKEKQ